MEISPEDEAAMAAFLRPQARQRTLADIILEKIQEKQQRQALGEHGGWASCSPPLLFQR